MATWPVSLPDFTHPVTYVERDNRVRTPLDAGPDKVRSRFSGESTDVGIGDMVLTQPQLLTLETFYSTTLSNGTDTFTKNDPITGASREWRFMNRPTYQLLVPATSEVDRVWTAQMSFEILPTTS